MTSDNLQSLRNRVEKARAEARKRKEAISLKRELFQLENPGKIAFKKGFVRSVKAFGTGAVVTAKGIQKFAVQREKVSRLREEGRKKAVPAIKKATRKKQKAIKSARKKAPISSGFEFDSGFGDFRF